MHEAGNQADPTGTGQLTLADSVSDQFISIHMGEGSPEIFRLSFNRDLGQVVATIAEGASIDDAARIFINELRFHGQSLMDTIKSLDLKLEQLSELSHNYPNDMEFGNKARQYIYDNCINRTR